MDGPMLAISLLFTWLIFVGWLFLRATAHQAPDGLPRADRPPSGEPLWVSERGWTAYVESGIAALVAHLRSEPQA